MKPHASVDLRVHTLLNLEAPEATNSKNTDPAMSTVPLTGELREIYSSGFARIRQDFAASDDGRAAIRHRAELVDQIVLRLWDQILQPHSEPAKFALVAIGGYGRRSLFPFSDVDLLFLHADLARTFFLRTSPP